MTMKYSYPRGEAGGADSFILHPGNGDENGEEGWHSDQKENAPPVYLMRYAHRAKGKFRKAPTGRGVRLGEFPVATPGQSDRGSHRDTPQPGRSTPPPCPARPGIKSARWRLATVAGPRPARDLAAPTTRPTHLG